MKSDKLRMAVSSAFSGAVFLVLYLVMDWHLAVCVPLCIGTYFGLFFFLKPNRKIGGIDVESMADGEEIDRLLTEAEEDIRDIGKTAAKIEDEYVRRDAEALNSSGLQIIGYLRENPDKVMPARRFFTYYLDTAARLISRYVEFQATGLKSGEVREILEKTAGALPVLQSAFDRQFTHLMQGELMDVEADIELLKSTLEMEGGR